MSFTLTPRQEEALVMIQNEPFSLLTGGPGTGKTSILKFAYQAAAERKETTVLAAPTGKAARRMTEAIGAEACTLHRLLGLRVEGKQDLQDDMDRPLAVRGGVDSSGFVTASRVFVDESSMLDVFLAAALVNRINLKRTKVTFIGDDYQLPSVGPGRVLADLLSSGKVPATILVEVHRAALESWVCTWAPVIRRGGMPELKTVKDFSFWETPGDEVESSVVEAVAALKKKYGVLPAVITPRRSSAFASADALNGKLQDLINPKMPEQGWAGLGNLNGYETKARAGDYLLRTGDYVIQRKNDYTVGVYNGECGTFRGVVEGKSETGGRRDFALIQFEGHDEESAIPVDDLNVRLAYALTVHSTQGSQWPWVVVVCHSGHGRMLSRQLFYTAVTRAQKGVLLIGDTKGVQMALRNDAPLARRTALPTWLA